MATKPKTKRPKNEVIKSSAATLLKQIGTYRGDLPLGDLRNALNEVEKDVEQIVGRLDKIFPTAKEAVFENDESLINTSEPLYR